MQAILVLRIASHIGARAHKPLLSKAKPFCILLQQIAF